MHMEMQNTTPERRPNPRRKPRSKFQIFKEAYLPLIIVAVTFVLILVFIIGGISRAARNRQENDTTQTTPSTTEATASTADPALIAEVNSRLSQAAMLAEGYDYAGALAILEDFSGDMEQFPQLSAAHAEYTQLLDSMVEWTGDQVPNLSFHLLIADAQRAFRDQTYGNSYRKNFITVSEFNAILQQLYDNGYILVSLSDLYETEFDPSVGREVYKPKTLMLPEGKKPLMLTETNANYYTYMVDSNGDGEPDAGADGFAYNLCYGENGFYNEIVLADGTVTSGAYDLVPLLENFIAEHPDFSYRDARAIIAITGYDGILGHRVHTHRYNEEQKQAAKDAAKKVVDALRNTGYEIACFTYENASYSSLTAVQIQEDLEQWADVVASVIGSTDILVYAKEADIAGEEVYNNNSKFNVMHNQGYRFFLGTGTVCWNQVENLYVRHNRLMVTGSYLQKHPEWFAELFDAASVLDAYRDNFN